ncbi:hypothetical protein C7S16_6762 [Burkholderia thailandensis]|uniref:Uncharacterized protein n=1 Tax=Burkholderia thailandensis TaxID=57975 RepID=A0AAW9CWR6_BURTH|nr:hypothetical protein [Burkholderia thailandensis]
MTDIADKFMGSQKNGATASNRRAVSRPLSWFMLIARR